MLHDLGVSQSDIRDLLRPSDRMIVVKSGDEVAYAGMPQIDHYDRDMGVVTASTVELRRIFRWRLTHGVDAVLTLGDLGVAGKSIPGAVRRILYRGMLDGTPGWDFPIDLPADGAGSFSADWLGSDLFTINDLLVQIEKAGYEVFLRPYLTDGMLRFETEVGSPIELAATDLSVTAPKSPVTGLQATLDGSEQVTGVFVAGNGWGPSLVSAYHNLIMDPGAVSNFPIRDAYWQSKEIKDTTQLQGIADARFAEFNPLVEQWSFSLNCADGLSPMVAAPGRVLNMHTQGDPWIPDGKRSLHVVALSGDLSSTVKVETR
jgi:hypothetical protein